MKVTKRQLRRIIKEEKRRLLGEGSLQSAEENANNALWELLDRYLDEHLDLGETNREEALENSLNDIRNFIDGFVDGAMIGEEAAGGRERLEEPMWESEY
jgi:glycyl-tRNA synthetase beta subunit